MQISTRTTISDWLNGRSEGIEVCADHGRSDNIPIGITVGCVDVWISVEDTKKIIRLLNKALSIRKGALK